MSLEDVHAVLAAAATVDPAAKVALRLAAVAGVRRAELAALRWDEVLDGLLTIDSAIETVRRGSGHPELRDAPTKTANVRIVALDADTLALIEGVRVGRGLNGRGAVDRYHDPGVPGRGVTPPSRLTTIGFGSRASCQGRAPLPRPYRSGRTRRGQPVRILGRPETA